MHLVDFYVEMHLLRISRRYTGIHMSFVFYEMYDLNYLFDT